MEKKKVLVTGGNGFIGAHITNKLIEQGFEVYVICRSGKSENTLFNDNVNKGKIKIIKADIFEFDYSNLKEDFSYIIHVAGKVSAYGKLQDFMNINYNSTKKLLEFAKTLQNLECFTYLSSTAVYGYYGYKNLKENDLKRPFNNPYSISKLETENLVTSFCIKNNINYIIARPGNVYGEYDYTSSYEIYSRVKNCKMSICANGKYLSCFVYVGNLANAVIYLSTNKLCYNTDYNITDGHNETLKEYLAKVAEKFGVKPKFHNYPAFIAKMVANIVESTYKLLHIRKAPLITRFSVWQNCADYNFSINKLLSTGYTIETDFDTAVKKTVNWFNSIENK